MIHSHPSRLHQLDHTMKILSTREHHHYTGATDPIQ
jgi:hypothetical protein